MTSEDRFNADIPEADRDEVLTILAEAAQDDFGKPHKDIVTILDRDRYNAINVKVSGILSWKGVEYAFHLQDGDWNGTEILAWDEDKPFVHHQPTIWTLQPTLAVQGKWLGMNQAGALLKVWDGFLQRPEVAAIPDSYAYDRRVQPGCKSEQHYKERALSFGLELVSEDMAQDTRKRLQALAV